ncbi:MAG: methionine adenosyltransferase, partial [Planctomycetota bacterium]
QGVDEDATRQKDLGAGDQGIMFGYACRETEELMPLPIVLARKICNRLAEIRHSGELRYLRPDGKSQVTVEYEGDKPVRLHTIVVSAQHDPDVSLEVLRHDIIERVVKPLAPKGMLDDRTIYHVNPTGRFVEGGPKADCGLTGRKIIVDTYGGMGHHGGGCFSGKDPTKVDRSACYFARYAAKNVVAAGLADRCEIQLGYAIGVSKPVSIAVDTYGTGKVADAKIVELLWKHFDFTPAGMIKHLDLRRPIYKQTARYGHFGIDHPDYTWESTDKAETLAREAGLVNPVKVAAAAH